MKIFPRSMSYRLMLLLLILFMLVLAIIKSYYSQSVSYYPLRIPSPKARLAQIPSPNPSPVIRSFTGDRQSLLINIPKYLDVTGEMESYEVSFDKTSAKSGFYLTKEAFPTLIILDNNYKFSVMLAKEAVGDIEELEKPFIELPTDQFGILKKIIIDTTLKNVTVYKYFSDYYTVNLFPKSKDEHAEAYITCEVIEKDLGNCDRIISTISIALK